MLYGMFLNRIKSGPLCFLTQLSRCACMITFRKPFIASLKICMIGLGTAGPFDYNLIHMDDYPTDSCAISSTTFLLSQLSCCAPSPQEARRAGSQNAACGGGGEGGREGLPKNIKV